jgi:hypothetical protein
MKLMQSWRLGNLGGTIQKDKPKKVWTSSIGYLASFGTRDVSFPLLNPKKALLGQATFGENHCLDVAVCKAHDCLFLFSLNCLGLQVANKREQTWSQLGLTFWPLRAKLTFSCYVKIVFHVKPQGEAWGCGLYKNKGPMRWIPHGYPFDTHCVL